MVALIIEATVTLILVYLVLANPQGFSSAAGAGGAAYVGAVRALQGR